ncbi:alpha/beta fold hydrolase [Nonomuraea sp. C10]|uniref:alpha/beta fold hydrolase n=1 Tax=Nonomuraea sp. C10 TaxID=2600577 RepID=UPI001C9CF7B1|nr:alpha/beta hydrolase [Nonomuraea sp. C10]
MESLDVPGGRIAYRVSGEGPLVVLVHGMGDTHRTFRHLIPRLAGHRVAAMDVRGYGASGTGWPGYGVDAIGSDVLALIRRLGGPATVIGHSIGCSSAVWAAAESPESVSGLGLIGTFSGETKVKAWMRAASWLVGRNAGLWGMFLRTSYPSARPDDFDAYLSELKAALRAPGGMVPLRAQIALSLAGVANRYAEVTQPSLLVMGGKDADFPDPAGDAARTAAKLGGPATVRVIDGAGHYPHAEMPDQTAEALLPFLATITPPLATHHRNDHAPTS